MPRMRYLFSALLLLAAGLAHADGPLPGLMNDSDTARLTAWPAARAAALSAARDGAQAETLELVDRVLDALPGPLDGSGLEGEWQCRVLRIAGTPAQLEVNGWFACRLDDDGAGLALAKDSGSWRTRGRFYDLGNSQMAYLGVRGAAGDAAVPRGEDPARDHFAVAVSPGPDRLRLEFPPGPADDWQLEVLELRRTARAAANLCAPELPVAYACPHARSGTVAALCEGAAGPIFRLGRDGVTELELPGMDGAAQATLLREPEIGGELKGVAFDRGEWRYVMSYFVGGRPVQASTFLSIRHHGAPAIALPCAVPPAGAEALSAYFDRLEAAGD